MYLYFPECSQTRLNYIFDIFSYNNQGYLVDSPKVDL